MLFKRVYFTFTFFISVFLLFSSNALALTRDITFPVNGVASFRDDFHEPRGADGTREHLGIDIIAAKMTPIVSAVDGVVSYVVSPQASWGYSISIRDSEGYQYRYLHINNDTPGTDDGLGGEANAYVAGIKRGVNVTAGQHIGWVGDSGNAEATVSHLHFEIRDPNRVVINPYETLVAAAAKNSNNASIKTGSTVVISHTSEGDQGVAAGSAYIFIQNLSEGDKAEAVRQLQIKLKALGYFTSTVTDYFGPITRAALMQYQSANNIAPTGNFDTNTRALLNEDVALLPDTPNILAEDLFEGAHGEAVRQLQTKLKALGYYKAVITDFFDSITREAIRSFQVATKINPTGYVDQQTWAKLQEEIAKLPAISPISGTTNLSTQSLQEGSSGEAVRQLQIKLQTLGYFSVSPTGYFGPITKTSVINFQRAKNIDPIGLVGPKTRAALNAI
ncbi:MAG: peptidoglycan-binding protein [bacterium]|nr:peptidoglycan-binding protein [bacterium]